MKYYLLIVSLIVGIILASPLQAAAQETISENNQLGQAMLMDEPLNDEERAILQEFARLLEVEFAEVIIELEDWAKNAKVSKKNIVQHVSTLIAGQSDPSIPLDLPNAKFSHDGESIPPGE